MKTSTPPMPSMSPLDIYKKLRRGDNVAVLAHTPYGRICGGAVYEGYKTGEVLFRFPEGSLMAAAVEDVVYLHVFDREKRRV